MKKTFHKEGSGAKDNTRGIVLSFQDMDGFCRTAQNTLGRGGGIQTERYSMLMWLYTAMFRRRSEQIVDAVTGLIASDFTNRARLLDYDIELGCSWVEISPLSGINIRILLNRPLGNEHSTDGLIHVSYDNDDCLALVASMAGSHILHAQPDEVSPIAAIIQKWAEQSKGTK